MKRLVTLLYLAILSLGTYGQATQCEVPSDIQPLLSQKWKGWRLLQIIDLRVDDQKLWRQHSGKACPGITKGHFFDGDSIAYAFMLINESKEVLIVAAPDKDSFRLITPTGPSSVTYFSVVRTLPPGRYSDFYADKKIVTKLDSVAVEAIEHSTEIFYWSKNSFQSLLISD